jgi:hypothetical protein
MQIFPVEYGESAKALEAIMKSISSELNLQLEAITAKKKEVRGLSIWENYLEIHYVRERELKTLGSEYLAIDQGRARIFPYIIHTD